MMNSTQNISVKCTCSKGAVLPVYQTLGAAGADVCAYLTEPLTILAGSRAIVPTGLFFEIPIGYEIQIRPRSGLAAKHGITCLNSPGTIDSDYRGEVKVILANHGTENITITDGERIAQLVIAPVYHAHFVLTDDLSLTKRGSDGFGSTGLL